MTIEDVKRVVAHFVKSVQLPSSYYSISINETSSSVEIQIVDKAGLYYDLVLTASSVHVLYNTEYKQENLFTEVYEDTVHLLSILSTIFYMAIAEAVNLTYLDFMAIVLGGGTSDWQEFVCTLAKAFGIQAEPVQGAVLLNGELLSREPNKLTYQDIDYPIETDSFSACINMTFLVIEYVANLLDTQDSLFIEHEEPKDMPVDDRGMDDDETYSDDHDIDLSIDMDTPPEPDDSSTYQTPDFSIPEGAVTDEDITEVE